MRKKSGGECYMKDSAKERAPKTRGRNAVEEGVNVARTAAVTEKQAAAQRTTEREEERRGDITPRPWKGR
eukprot:3520398-Pleurochrysis_carterae.AAC.4